MKKLLRNFGEWWYKQWYLGVPDWAWYITWGIMGLGVLLNLILLLMRFQIIPTPVLR